MTGLKLIKELSEDVEYITEGTDTKKHFIVGPFLVAETGNGNGRWYPKGVLEEEVERYTKAVLNESRGYGELGHPDSPSINLDRVCHIIKELKQDGNTFIGKAQITEKTPMGAIALGLMEAGAKLGVSSRGLGALKKRNDGLMEVQKGFRLATAADIVANPSAPGAFVQGIMENVSWVYDATTNTYFQETLEDTRKELHRLTKTEFSARALPLFESLLAKLSKV